MHDVNGKTLSSKNKLTFQHESDWPTITPDSFDYEFSLARVPLIDT